MRIPLLSPERRARVRGYYDGIRAFKGYMRRTFGYGMPYDWADLSLRERASYARREATKRERRAEADRQRQP